MKKWMFLFAAPLFLAACNNQPAKPVVQIQGIDSTLSPGDNFFQYANRKWMDTAQIPPSQPGVGAYMFMNYPQRLKLQGILDSVSKADNAQGSIAQKIGDFYASGMDTSTINKRGFDPVKPVPVRIDGISDVPSLMKFVAEEMKHENNSILGFGVWPSQSNSKLNIAHVYQAGIGLPERDYYFKTDPSTAGIQEAYKKYLSTLFELTGTDSATAKKDAETVYISKNSWQLFTKRILNCVMSRPIIT